MSDSDLSRAVWRKSRRSNNGGNCVEVAGLDAATAVRDSKDPASPTLIFTHGDWSAFSADVKTGRFDL